uniref:Tyrosine recombinase XerC n=1 Tax=Candidatus Kentrum sp. LPFa TaxID=2126335 RepID=A0A450WLK4_9GAMM|nr:MAG: integrase/recombinase XerC [Candidatus Kentron sp. LPFa]
MSERHVKYVSASRQNRSGVGPRADAASSRNFIFPIAEPENEAHCCSEQDQLRDLIQAFIDHLLTERRLSNLTGKAYLLDLQCLHVFCREHGITSWDRLDAAHIRSFVGLQRRLERSPHAIQRLLSAMRGFYRFLIREGHVTHDPVTGIAAPRRPRRLPKVPDVDQMAGLLDARQESPLAIRDWAMMELLYSSGLRLAELVGLDLSDLDLNERLVRVTGKGNKERIAPIGKEARQAILQWLDARSRITGIVEESALFVSRNKTRLTARAIQARLQKLGIAQNMNMPLHPHLFRHAFASHLLESSGDLRAVQEILGHADITTTQIYTHLDFQHLANVYDETHPRAKSSAMGDDAKSTRWKEPGK